MVKAKKTETTTPEATAPVTAAAETTTSKKTKSTKKTTTPVVEAKVDDVKTTTTTTTTTETTDVTESVLTDTFTEFMAKLQAVVTQLNSLKTEFRNLEKKSVREIKLAQKANAKRKRKSSNRSPSGFVKPTKISNELATFLNKPIGTEMARTEVTREINGYIRSNNLQDKSNGRKINPDKSLAALLKIGNGEELTYFNLQRYMSPHFAKATPTVSK
tara:strand:+ start:4438 stop:5085 length:648 start_codon:yes stop_codon:yes gene_type:complete